MHGRSVRSALILVAIGAPSAAAHQAHVHGQATVQVSLEATKLAVSVDSALDNLLGFERAPRNDAQRRLVEALAARLRKSETVVLPAAEGACQSAGVHLHAPVLAGTPAHDAASPATAPDPGDHGNMTATYTFVCAKPQDLRAIEFKLFEGFPRLQRVNAQVAGPRGQSAQRLTAKRSQIKL